MTNLKSLRYETRNAYEKKKIEDMMMSKLGKWKYSSDQLSQQILKDLLHAIKLRWENARKTKKDIFE